MKRAALVLLCGGLVACSKGGEEEASSATSFVANATSFQGFRSWRAETLHKEVVKNSPHIGGTSTIYINALPVPGATEFPMGTLIVKETHDDAKLFARAKRGAGFNKVGAVGWEWIELKEDSAGLSIKWRGFGPPAGEKYGGDPKAGCNGCHKLVPTNDYVLSAWLSLVDRADAGEPALDASPDASSDDAGLETEVQPSTEGGSLGGQGGGGGQGPEAQDGVGGAGGMGGEVASGTAGAEGG